MRSTVPQSLAGRFAPVVFSKANWRNLPRPSAYGLETNDWPGCCDAALPGQAFVLDRHGLARALSLPPDRDFFISDIVSSYRVRQGVLHNPKSDRRTTQGIFHIAEGGFPVPDDKRAAPGAVFAQMLRLAFSPPCEMLRLPFTSGQQEQAEWFVT